MKGGVTGSEILYNMHSEVRTRGVVKGREDNEAETEAAREEVLRILVLVLQEERKDGDKAQ